MFATVLKELTGQLADRRFFLNAFLPVVVFVTALASVILNGQRGISPALDAWQKRDGTTQVLLAIGAVAFIYVVASVIAGGWLGVIRLYEGYAGPAKWWGARARTWHSGQRDRHLTETEYQDVYYYYSLPPDEVMPTLLGNVLRSSERYGHDRYAIDTAVVWPRLFALLPADVAQAVSDARAALEAMLVLSLLSTVFAAVSGPYLVVTDGAPWLFLLCTAGALTIAYATYRSAIANAVVYGEHIKSALDLHRSLVLEKLRIPLPSTLAEERRRWSEVNALLYRNIPARWAMTAKPSK